MTSANGDSALEALTQFEWRYGDHDAASLAEFKRRISARAQRPEPRLTYSELVDGIVFNLPNVHRGQPYQIDVSNWTSLDRKIVGDFLGRVDTDSYRVGQFFGSALVVQAEDHAPGQPSEPFFKLARDVGLLRGNDETAKLTFWTSQMDAATNWLRANPERNW